MAEINLADFDSRAVRGAARRLKACSKRLSDGTKSTLETLQGELPDNLQGQAADSLQGRLGDLKADLNTIVGNLDSMVRLLLKYADELDRTAEKLRQQMQQG